MVEATILDCRRTERGETPIRTLSILVSSKAFHNITRTISMHRQRIV